MTTAVIVTNDSVGNSAVTPSVLQIPGQVTRVTFVITLNGVGSGPFEATIQFIGSVDGQNWNPLPTFDVRGPNGTVYSKSISRNWNYWTCNPVFTTPNTTYSVSITY